MMALFAIVAALGVLLVISPPPIFPDPANGFQVMRCMELGGKFNRMITPDQDDFYKFYIRAQARGWAAWIMEGDHNVQRSHPHEVVRLLEGAAK